MALDPSERYYIKLKAAYLYYHEDITQQQLADQLNISRLTLNKLLKEAREEGIVKIEVQDIRGYSSLIRLENEVCKRFDLKNVKITASISDDPAEITAAIARTAASYFDSLVSSRMRVGIGWGKTLETMSTFITPSPRISKAQFVTLLGGSSARSSSIHANTLVEKIARRYTDSTTRLLYAPIYFENESLSAAFLKDPDIKSAMNAMKTLDVALIGVDGGLDTSTTIQTGVIQDKYIRILVKERAVGNICARFYNIDGDVCAKELNKQLIAIPLQTLQNIPTVIAVAGGKQKTASLIGAARGKYYNTLITDEHTAKSMLEYSL